MTPAQMKAVAIAQRLATRLKRRPLASELRKEGVTCGPGLPFLRVNALLVAADLALPAPTDWAGFTDAEDRLLRRLAEAGSTVRDMAKALGVMDRVMGNELEARKLGRSVTRRQKGEPEIHLRRCQAPRCGKLTQGAGPCRHCGAGGLTSAA